MAPTDKPPTNPAAGPSLASDERDAEAHCKRILRAKTRSAGEVVEWHMRAIRKLRPDLNIRGLRLKLEGWPRLFPALPAARADDARAEILSAAREALKYDGEPLPRASEVRALIRPISSAARVLLEALKKFRATKGLPDVALFLVAPWPLADLNDAIRLVQGVAANTENALARLALRPGHPHALSLPTKGPAPRNLKAWILVEHLANSWKSLTGERPPAASRSSTRTSFEKLAMDVGGAIGLRVTSHVIIGVERARNARLEPAEEVAQ